MATIWFIWLLGGLASVVGAGVAVCALLGDEALGRGRSRRRRCPKCWYDMRGLDSTLCPECGRDAGSERRLRKSRRRWRAALLAIACAAVGAGSIAGSARWDSRWFEHAPDVVLVWVLPMRFDWRTDPIYRELMTRQSSDDLAGLTRWCLGERAARIVRGGRLEDDVLPAWRSIVYAHYQYSGSAMSILVRDIETRNEHMLHAVGSLAMKGHDPDRWVPVIAEIYRQEPDADRSARLAWLLTKYRDERTVLPMVLKCIETEKARDEHSQFHVAMARLVGAVPAETIPYLQRIRADSHEPYARLSAGQMLAVARGDTEIGFLVSVLCESRDPEEIRGAAHLLDTHDGPWDDPPLRARLREALLVGLEGGASFGQDPARESADQVRIKVIRDLIEF